MMALRLAALGLLLPAGASTPTKPHLMFFLTDDLGYSKHRLPATLALPPPSQTAQRC